MSDIDRNAEMARTEWGVPRTIEFYNIYVFELDFRGHGLQWRRVAVRDTLAEAIDIGLHELLATGLKSFTVQHGMSSLVIDVVVRQGERHVG